MDDLNRSREPLSLRSASAIGDAAAAKATPPPFSELRRKARTGARRTTLFAAAVVLVAVGAGVVVVQQTSSVAPLPMTPPSPVLSDPPGTVAWAPLPATHPTIETHTIQERPDPAIAQAAPTCTADHLDASSALDGAGGQWVLSVTFRNTGTQPCHLTGAPTWSFQIGGNAVHVPQTVIDTADDYGRPVLLRGGRKAEARAMWATQDCSSSKPATVIVTAPGTHTALSAGSVKASPVCAGPDTTVADVRVSTVAPQDGWRPEREASDWAGTRVHIEPPARLIAGNVAQYVVDLTSPRDVSMATCPDHVVQLTARGAETFAQETFELNCAEVPYTDAAGQRQLPADTQVSFAMRVHVPEGLAGKQVKFVWQLDVPEPVSAALAVPVT